jgi:hypothetical protein
MAQAARLSLLLKPARSPLWSDSAKNSNSRPSAPAASSQPSVLAASPHIHATLLHQLGIDPTQLIYRHGLRDYRLTDVHGEVVKDIVR